MRNTLRCLTVALLVPLLSPLALAQAERPTAPPAHPPEREAPRVEALVERGGAEVFTDRAAFGAACGTLPVEGFDEADVQPNAGELIPSPLDATTTAVGVTGVVVFEPGDILPGLTVSAESATTGATGNLFVAGPGFAGAPSPRIGTTASQQNLVFSFEPTVDCAGAFFDPSSDAPVEVQALDGSGNVLGQARVTAEGFVGVESTGEGIAVLVALAPEDGFVDADDVAFGDAAGAAQLVVTLTPQSSTTVPAGSGLLVLYSVENASPDALTGGLFFYAEQDGATRAQGRIDSGTLPPGATTTGLYFQQVPGAAPAGAYDYFICVGPSIDAPTECSESITVQVTRDAARIAERTDASTAWIATGGSFGSATARASAFEALAAGVEVYPNPSAGPATLSFSLAERGEVSVVLYDVRGREVARLAGGTLEVGTHRIAVDGADLPSGTYLYRVTTGAQVETGRFTLTR